MGKMSKNSILIVDDERANISALKDILSPDYKIYASSDGQEAIETCENFLPDLVLLDIIMPETDGYAVISALKSSEKTKHIPVIFITGLESSESEDKCFSFGAADYIQKPFHPSIVKHRVQNQIEIANHVRTLAHQYRQQALMTKISNIFNSGIYIDVLFNETLRMIGEFMGITQILLYKVEDESTLLCQYEWKSPELGKTPHCGDRIVLNTPMQTIIKNLHANEKEDLCFNSNEPLFREAMSPYRQNYNNYIVAPIFIRGKMAAVLDFSVNSDDYEWCDSEMDLAVLVAGVFSGVFERDAMERQFSIVESSPNFILYVTAQGVVEYANPASLPVTGYASYELLSEEIDLLFDSNTLSDIKNIHIPKALSGESVVFEADLIRKNSEKCILMFAIVKIGDNDIGIITTDLTEMRVLEAENERNRYEARLSAEANLAKSRFLATMSHEIRTPMNAIIGISEFELERDNLSDETKESLNRIYNSGQNLLRIVNEILDLSKIESGKLELLHVKYDVAKMISETAALNATRIGNKPVQFVLKVNENLPKVLFGDELRVKQILTNLLSNAIKYTDSGSVTLEVDIIFDNKIPTLVFMVSDTGQGMTKEQLEKLYDDYSQFNKKTNRFTEGTGLGMSITKNLVELMGGSIQAESEFGFGSVITAFLPQRKINDDVIGKEQSKKLQNFDFPNDIQKEHIIREQMPYGSVLIVDDIEENLFVANGLMKPYSLTIETALSGFKALEKIKSGKVYDIVFMDHMMPGMDGIETTNKIRNLGYTQTIIALTANAVVGQEKIFYENGFDDFISKPIDTRRLNTVLNKYVRDKKIFTAVDDAFLTQSSGITLPTAQKEPKSIESIKIAHKVDTLVLLTQLEELDVDIALASMNGLPCMYLDAVELTMRLLPQKLEKMDMYIEYNDAKSFTIEVHGLKTALRNIGATALGHVAESLELSAMSEKTEQCKSDYPQFRNALIKLHKSLNEVFSDNSTHQ